MVKLFREHEIKPYLGICVSAGDGEDRVNPLQHKETNIDRFGAIVTAIVTQHI